MKTDSARRNFLRTGACALGALLMTQESPAASGPLARRVPKGGEAIPAVGLGTWQAFDVASDAKEKAQAQETLKVFVDLEKIIRPGDIDFVQVNYSLAEPEADRRLLAAAADSRTAVIVNRPFAEGSMFRRVRGEPLPAWAQELGCASWAQFFLKWILGHPSVTCAIPGTRNPKHVADNLGAASGPLPDEAMRRRMSVYFESL